VFIVDKPPSSISQLRGQNLSSATKTIVYFNHRHRLTSSQGSRNNCPGTSSTTGTKVSFRPGIIFSPRYSFKTSFLH